MTRPLWHIHHPVQLKHVAPQSMIMLYSGTSGNFRDGWYKQQEAILFLAMTAQQVTILKWAEFEFITITKIPKSVSARIRDCISLLGVISIDGIWHGNRNKLPWSKFLWQILSGRRQNLHWKKQKLIPGGLNYLPFVFEISLQSGGKVSGIPDEINAPGPQALGPDWK